MSQRSRLGHKRGSLRQPSPPWSTARSATSKKKSPKLRKPCRKTSSISLPKALNIPGADYKGVRTFAWQVKHVAASNFALYAPLTGDTFPRDFLGGNGPENLKTKAEIMKLLHDSFALGHKAAATLTTENMLQPLTPGGSTVRLHRATFAVAHAFDHYGQMVEYLRMNGIVPPASRGKSD